MSKTTLESTIGKLVNALNEEFGDQSEWAIGGTLGAMMDNWHWNIGAKQEKVRETTSAIRDMLDPYIQGEGADTRSLQLPEITELKVERKIQFIDDLEQQVRIYEGLMATAQEHYTKIVGRSWKPRTSTKTAAPKVSKDRLAALLSR